MSMNEPRIYGTKKEEAEYKENFNAIDWGDREELLARLRKEKEGRG